MVVAGRIIADDPSRRFAFVATLTGIVALYAANADVPIPEGFRLGVATSSYQIEGGWNASGKGENVWDRLTHTRPDLITGHVNGDITCDSYHRWETDVENLVYLGVDHYRFSISWARILPHGFANKINDEGVAYYRNLIKALIEHKIEPIVTIFHWELPQTLQDLGGWTNPAIADYFEDYARVVFEQFGDLVKTWITINEPYSLCWDTYEAGMGAVVVQSPGIGLYLCGKAVLLAHAKAYRLYNSDFKSMQKGKVGITLNTNWNEPKTNKTEDADAAYRELQMTFGWFAQPIFSVSGDYPQIMKERIANLSRLEGYPSSRLPELTKIQIRLIRGTFDFMGLNHYHTSAISNKNYVITSGTSYAKDKGTEIGTDPNWKPSPDIVPWGLRKLLNFIKNAYENPEVIITENGYADSTGQLDDRLRVLYVKEYLKNTVLAVIEDNCHVTGYTAWSFMDNLEWRSGYSIKFGLFNVNFKDSLRTRKPKMSAEFYKYVTKSRRIPDK